MNEICGQREWALTGPTCRIGSRVYPTVVRWAIALAFVCTQTPIVAFADDARPATARVGLVVFGSAEAMTHQTSGFRDELRKFGYVEGQNLEIESRWAGGDIDRLEPLANELVQRKVDVLVASNTYAVRAAKKATSVIPIVMVTSADPVATGLVADLAHPEANVTGNSLMTIELSAKRLQILKDALPQLTRIAVLWNPDHPFHSRAVEGIRSIAPSLGVNAVFVSANTPQQLLAAIVAAKRANAQALCVIEDPFFFLHRATISDLATKQRLPAIYAAKEYAEAGGMMSYGPSLKHLWRRAAGYVNKIMKGAKPQDLPIEQPTEFELVVNLKAAKNLGLKISESTLLQATDVIR